MSSNYVETVRRAHEAFSNQDLETAAKLVASDCQVTDHGRGQVCNGRDEFRGWMASFFDMASDIRLDKPRYIDAGDWVVAQFQAVGTQDGPMETFPASNKPFTLDVCELWHFNANGEADEGHNYSDGLGMLMQLGHLPLPEAVE